MSCKKKANQAQQLLSGVRKLNRKQEPLLVCCFVDCSHVLIFSVIGRNAINIPEIFQAFMVSPVALQKLKSFILLFIACVASISELFWRKTARKMALVSLLVQPKTENLIPRSFFATKQHGNTCYTG